MCATMVYVMCLPILTEFFNLQLNIYLSTTPTNMGGSTVVPGYAQAYPTFLGKQLVASMYMYMYNVGKL